MKKTRLGLIGRIALLVISIEVAAFGGLGWFYINRYSTAADQQIHTRLRLVGEMIAQDELTISAIARKSFLAELVGVPCIDSIAIGGNGRVIVASDATLLGREVRGVPGFDPAWTNASVANLLVTRRPDQLTSVSQIRSVSGGAPLYTIAITVSTADLNAEKRTIILRGLIGSLMFILLTSLGIILVVQRFVARRVDSALIALKSVEDGDLSARIAVTSDDELGEMQQGVNSMIAKVSELLEDFRQNETELLESQHLLNRAQAVAKIGSWHLDLTKNQLSWSNETCRIFGTPNGTPLAYEDFIARVHPDDRNAVNAAWQASLSDAPYDITHRIIVAGKIKWVREMAEFIFDAQHKLLAATGTVQDVTHQIDVECALRGAMQAAEAANRAKSEFLANMSHEIRTPMNAILGLTQLVLDTPLEPRQRDFLSKALGSGRALLGILNDILDYSKIEAGRLDIDKSAFSVEEVLREVGDLFSARLAEKDIELFFDIAPDLPAEVIGDPLRLHQVLANLIGNAIKFTERGEIHVLAETVPSTTNSEGDDRLTLRFAVRDTGIGIRRELAQHLFEPFTQADGSITRKYGGTGLGLAICHRLVTLMGGEIAASGDEGQGATFTFTLIVDHSNQDHTNLRLQEIAGMKVLVVDDQSSAREIFGKLLAAWGVDYDTAADGQTALDMIAAAHVRRDGYCIVLLDWQMPGLNGVEIARRIASDPDHYGHALKVMMVTAHDRDKLIQAAGELNFDGILTKPVTPSLLFDALMGSRVQPLASPTSRLRQKSALAGRHFGGGRVLVAEDNRYNQQVAAGFLEKLGITVTLADNGSEALAMAGHANFDVIFMDLHMPVMDGLEATRRIRALPEGNNVPIIAMTAAVMEEDRERCRAAGMNDFVPKPVDPDELMRVLSHYLNTSTDSLPAAGMTEIATAPLPDLPGFDLPAALRRVGGDRPLLERLLIDFAQTHADFTERLAARLTQGDLHEAASKLHTLKGVASNLGMTELAEAVRQMESEVRAGNTPPLDALVLKIGEARQAIATLEVSTDNHTAIPPDTAAIAALIERLRPYLEERELVPDDALQALAALARAGLRGAPFARLLRQIDDFDHDGALASLAQIAAQFELPLHSST